MLRTPVCDLIGIRHPIVQGPFGPVGGADIVAAVSNAGGLGSFATALRSTDDVRRELGRLRELTDQPFAVNHTIQTYSEEAMALTLEARPAVVSFALGDPGDLVARAHDAGSLFMQQVHTVQQARQAAERGVDIIIAQGSEAGGFSGVVGGIALVPQVVAAVDPIPVLAAGGIADGRGLAAALVLGAQGVNIGTRFLAAAETAISVEWKRAILTAESEQTERFDAWYDIFPRPTGPAFDTLPRVLSTRFVQSWRGRHDEARREAERLRGEVAGSLQRGRLDETVPFTGQTVGLIDEILPAAEIIASMVEAAERILREAPKLTG